MSFEYFACIPRDKLEALGGVLSEIANQVPTTQFSIITQSDEKLSFRWTNQLLRVDWPEDFDLFLEPDGVSVSIHTGTAQMRAAVLNVIGSILAGVFGGNIEFEES